MIMIHWGLYQFVCTYEMNASHDKEDAALLWILFWWISGHDGIPQKVTRCYYILQAGNIGAKRFNCFPLFMVALVGYQIP